VLGVCGPIAPPTISKTAEPAIIKPRAVEDAGMFSQVRRLAAAATIPVTKPATLMTTRNPPNPELNPMSAARSTELPTIQNSGVGRQPASELGAGAALVPEVTCSAAGTPGVPMRASLSGTLI